MHIDIFCIENKASAENSIDWFDLCTSASVEVHAIRSDAILLFKLQSVEMLAKIIY